MTLMAINYSTLEINRLLSTIKIDLIVYLNSDYNKYENVRVRFSFVLSICERRFLTCRLSIRLRVYDRYFLDCFHTYDPTNL
jgi:hypothetical protein